MADVAQQLARHMVFFTLQDGSEDACQTLIAACHKYLTDQPGTVYWSVGRRVPDLNRPVNDQDYHVGFHIVFASRADHDRYQADERHQAFIAETKPTWKSVRIYDTYV